MSDDDPETTDAHNAPMGGRRPPSTTDPMADSHVEGPSQTDLISASIPILRTSLSGLLTLLAPPFLVFYLLSAAITVAIFQLAPGGFQQVVRSPLWFAVFVFPEQFLYWGCARRLIVDERGESFGIDDIVTILVRTPLVLLTAVVVLGATFLIGGAGVALVMFIFPPLAFLLLALLVLWATIRFSLAGHAMVGDSLGPGTALNRSRDITAGHRWDILLIVGLFFLLQSPFQFAVNYVTEPPLLPLLLGASFVRFGLYLTLSKVYLHVNDGLTVR